MLLISHRGNISGRNPERENTLPYIYEALEAGYHVEVDVIGKGNTLFLGHDKPLSGPIVNPYTMSLHRTIFHAKNQEAAVILAGHKCFHFFCHSEDDFVTSNQGLIINHSRVKPHWDSICMLPEIHGLSKAALAGCAGICSDMIEFYK